MALARSHIMGASYPFYLLADSPEGQQKEAEITRNAPSIAAKADYEYLYDKPYEDNKTVRVAGPFTVDSVSPRRYLGVDENDEMIDP